MIASHASNLTEIKKKLEEKRSELSDELNDQSKHDS
jgi:hypothetical protein